MFDDNSPSCLHLLVDTKTNMERIRSRLSVPDEVPPDGTTQKSTMATESTALTAPQGPSSSSEFIEPLETHSNDPRSSTNNLPSRPESTFTSCKTWNLQTLLSGGRRFKAVPRVSALSKIEMRQAIQKHENSGEPLIIDNLDKCENWPTELLSIDWLLQHKGGQRRCPNVLLFMA